MRAQSRALLLLTLLLSLSLAACFGGHGGGGGGGGGNGGNPSPAFQVTVTHAGNFQQGQQTATYTITVTNSGAAVTAGNVQVTATIPIGEILVSMTGTGWSTAGALSTRSDALAVGQSYPPITVTVNVTQNATSPQAMMVNVSGGGANFANAQDSTVIASAALFISGRFAFLFSGFDKNGAVAIAGAFTVDANGNVTGERDYKDPVNTNAAEPITGFCQNGTTAQTGICMLKGSAASLITSTYDIVFRASGQVARFVEDPADAPSAGSGVLIAQSAPPFTVNAGGFNGSYAFGMVGTDSATPAKRLGVVGTITTNATAVITSGQGDVNDNGTFIRADFPNITQNVTGTLVGTATGDATKSDSFGRIKTAAPGMVIGTAPASLTLNLGIYIVSLGRAFAVDSTPLGKNILAGQFFSVSNAPFSGASLSGVDVLQLWGVTSGGASNMAVGTIAWTAAAPNVRLDVNNNGVINGGAGLANPEIGALAGIGVAANGQAEFGLTVPVTTSYFAYLDAANDGFVLSADNNVSFGFLTAQGNTANFNNANIFGTYALGTFMPVLPTVQNVAGPITLVPGAANSGTFSIPSVVNGTYTFVPATGRGIATTTAGTVQNSVFYIITPNNIILMGADAGPGTGDAMSYLQF
jgi:uncharacterized repeat protein (TIGR01451 family)